MEEHKTLKVRYNGIRPLLMANRSSGDPLNKYAIEIKKVQGKRKKTEADYEQIAKLQFLSHLYLNDKRQLFLPAYMLKQNLVEAAKRVRKGHVVKEAVFITTNPLLNWNGKDYPEINPEQLFEKKEHVLDTIERTRPPQCQLVKACYPRFDRWSIEFEITYLPESIDERELVNILEDAAFFKGLGRKRPEYGIFEVEILN